MIEREAVIGEEVILELIQYMKESVIAIISLEDAYNADQIDDDYARERIREIWEEMRNCFVVAGIEDVAVDEKYYDSVDIELTSHEKWKK